MPDSPSAPVEQFETISAKLEAIQRALTVLADDVRQRALPPLDTAVTISTTPFSLRSHGRRHIMIFVAAAIAVSADTEIGPVSLNLTAGWNVLDLRDGTTVTTAASSQNAIIRAVNEVPPGLI